MERTLPKYAPSILALLIIPCIGHSKSHFLPLVLNGNKSVDFLFSEFFLHCDLSVRIFYQRVLGFAFHQCKFHFDSMYGGLDMPYGSNNMKFAKEGSLDV